MATRAAASLTGSLALGAVGGAFGGPVGAFAGSAVGGYLGTATADWAMQQNWTVLPSGTMMFTPIWLGPKSP